MLLLSGALIDETVVKESFLVSLVIPLLFNFRSDLEKFLID